MYLTPLSQPKGLLVLRPGTQSSAVVRDLTQSGELGACNSASRGHCQVAQTQTRSGCLGEWASLNQAIHWGKGLWEGLDRARRPAAKARAGEVVT